MRTAKSHPRFDSYGLDPPSLPQVALDYGMLQTSGPFVKRKRGSRATAQRHMPEAEPVSIKANPRPAMAGASAREPLENKIFSTPAKIKLNRNRAPTQNCYFCRWIAKNPLEPRAWAGRHPTSRPISSKLSGSTRCWRKCGTTRPLASGFLVVTE
jgi:hypothetical protein